MVLADWIIKSKLELCWGLPEHAPLKKSNLLRSLPHLQISIDVAVPHLLTLRGV